VAGNLRKELLLALKFETKWNLFFRRKYFLEKEKLEAELENLKNG
jgi:hypothetical protein